MSSIFDGIENASTTNAGNYIRPGTYRAEIQGVRLTKAFNKDEFVAIELKILEVLDGGDHDWKGKTVSSPHKAGEDVTHLLKVKNPSFLGNFKQFASAALGCHPDEVGKAEADRITSDEQPMAGIVVDMTARFIQKRNDDGKPFTKVLYRTVEDESASESTNEG